MMPGQICENGCKSTDDGWLNRSNRVVELVNLGGNPLR